jgi:hypothetical protein
LLYSLVQSCTLIEVSPFDYLKDVLLRVATHPQREHRIGLAVVSTHGVDRSTGSPWCRSFLRPGFSASS